MPFIAVVGGIRGYLFAQDSYAYPQRLSPAESAKEAEDSYNQEVARFLAKQAFEEAMERGFKLGKKGAKVLQQFLDPEPLNTIEGQQISDENRRRMADRLVNRPDLWRELGIVDPGTGLDEAARRKLLLQFSLAFIDGLLKAVPSVPALPMHTADP